jgi:hypothetical protein
MSSVLTNIYKMSSSDFQSYYKELKRHGFEAKATKTKNKYAIYYSGSSVLRGYLQYDSDKKKLTCTFYRIGANLNGVSATILKVQKTTKTLVETEPALVVYVAVYNNTSTPIQVSKFFDIEMYNSNEEFITLVDGTYDCANVLANTISAHDTTKSINPGKSAIVAYNTVSGNKLDKAIADGKVFVYLTPSYYSKNSGTYVLTGSSDNKLEYNMYAITT